MRAKRSAIATTVVVAMLIGVGVAFAAWPRGTTRITEHDALTAFRNGRAPAGAVGSASGAEDADRRSPRPGVYTYSADGQEEVKLGPLPTESRPLPPTVSATALPAGGGCYDWKVDLFAEHTEETRWCTAPVLRLVSHTKHQRLGPLTPTFTMTCDPGAFPAPEDTAGAGATTALTCTLRVDGGPVSVDTTIDGTVTRSPREETLTVGGIDVATTTTRLHFPVEGTIEGTWDETTWWSADNVPVRVERTLDLRGPATFRESSRLQLERLDPTA